MAAMDAGFQNSARSVLGGVARGLASGVAGTAAMSLSQAAEMTISGREPSVTPAEAACVLLRIETRSAAQEQRFAREAHWAYGTGWGLGQALLRRLPEPHRSLVYLATVWGAGAVLLTGLKLAPPPTRWRARSLLTDLAHHAVYTAAASLVFDTLERVAKADGTTA